MNKNICPSCGACKECGSRPVRDYTPVPFPYFPATPAPVPWYPTVPTTIPTTPWYQYCTKAGKTSGYADMGDGVMLKNGLVADTLDKTLI